MLVEQGDVWMCFYVLVIKQNEMQCVGWGVRDGVRYAYSAQSLLLQHLWEE